MMNLKRKNNIIVSFSLLMVPLLLAPQNATAKGIYHKGWIDFNKNGRMDVFENPNAPIDDRVQDLLRQMTVEEKTCQMATLYGSGRVLKDASPTDGWKQEIWNDGIANIDEQANGLGTFGSQISYPYTRSIQNRQAIQRWFVENTRLGIPVDFTNEGIRGLNHDRATMFPAQCAQGASWDKELISQIAEAEGKEAVALGYTNIYSPILDLAQDPRWGHVVESYGEDPYLVGELGKRMVIGLQKQGLVSTPKHFAVYSVPVGGRDGGTRTDPHVAPSEMRALYMEPFRKVMLEAKPFGVMSSYNDYDGVPITGSPRFLTQILRGEYGFKGYVVSDSEAVEFLLTKHHVAKDEVDAVAQAVNAGLNVRTNFTMPEKFILPLRKAIESGQVSMQTVDSRVTDVLRIKFQMGLFDNPYKGDLKQVAGVVHSEEHQALALKAALEGIVLLKNENQVLPLSKSLKHIAVIGPNADEVKKLESRYGPANVPIKTVVQGVRDMLPGADVKYAKGCDIIDKYFPESELYDVPLDAEEQKMMDEAVEVARHTDVAIIVLGGNELTVREEYSRTSLNLCGRQQKLLEAVKATGTPVVQVLVDGRASTINWAQKNIDGIVHAWFPGEFTGTAIAKVLFGDYNPGGKLAVTFPKSVGQIPFAFPMKPGSDSDGRVRVAHALYPFGYGLSYTSFQYGKMHLSQSEISGSDSVRVTCQVTNTGKMDGDEVVQLYIHDDVSSAIRYVKELRGFERVHLKAGETKEVSFVLTQQELGFWSNRDGKVQFMAEPGSFTLMIGSSSEDIRLKQTLWLK